jgi:hypothetical protein
VGNTIIAEDGKGVGPLSFFCLSRAVWVSSKRKGLTADAVRPELDQENDYCLSYGVTAGCFAIASSALSALRISIRTFCRPWLCMFRLRAAP